MKMERERGKLRLFSSRSVIGLTFARRLSSLNPSTSFPRPPTFPLPQQHQLMALEDAGVTTEDLRNFVATEEELPFPHPVPNFPLRRRPGVGLVDAPNSTSNSSLVSAAPPVASAAPSFAALGERPPPHVPAHFPAFPDKHSFQATPLFDGAGAGASAGAGGGRAGAAAAAAAVAAAVPTAGNLLAVAGRAGEDALVALSRRAGAPAAGSVGVGGAVAAAARGGAAAAAAPPPGTLLLPLAPTPALTADDGGLDAGAAAAAAAGAPPPAAPHAAAPLPAPPRPKDKRAAAVADAATARAEEILAAGSDAMGLEDKGD